jgi:predicted acetyltransferase
MSDSVVQIVRIGANERPIIENLLQLYLHDMTAELPFSIGEDGHYEYDYLDRFWRYPYLIRVGSEIAGFALIIDECPISGASPCFFVAEYFILRAYRGRGVGRSAFEQLLAEHAGRWHLGVIRRNASASAFWSCVMASHPHFTKEHQFDGESWLLYEFSV